MKRAQALLLALFLLLIVGILTGALAIMWKTEIWMRSLEKNGLIAFYLAQAGIERGKIEAANNPGLSGWRPCLDDNNSSCWYNDLSQGWYKFNIENMGGNLRRIQSKARTIGLSGETLAERQLEVIVDIVNRIKQVWSWQEI